MPLNNIIILKIITAVLLLLLHWTNLSNPLLSVSAGLSNPTACVLNRQKKQTIDEHFTPNQSENISTSKASGLDISSQSRLAITNALHRKSIIRQLESKPRENKAPKKRIQKEKEVELEKEMDGGYGKEKNVDDNCCQNNHEDDNDDYDEEECGEDDAEYSDEYSDYYDDDDETSDEEETTEGNYRRSRRGSRRLSTSFKMERNVPCSSANLRAHDKPDGSFPKRRRSSQWNKVRVLASFPFVGLRVCT